MYLTLGQFRIRISYKDILTRVIPDDKGRSNDFVSPGVTISEKDNRHQFTIGLQITSKSARTGQVHRSKISILQNSVLTEIREYK